MANGHGSNRAARARPRQASAAKPTLARARSAADERVVEKLRRLCLALPDAREKLSHGEPTWFAGTGKVFAMLDGHHHGSAHLSVWLPAPRGAQEALVGSDPARYFRPPYVGHRGWVAMILDGKPDWNLVTDLIEEAYRLVAPRRLVAQLEADSTRGR